MVEVGPGPGGLTRALLHAGAAEVIAIERDRRCIEALRDLERAAAGRLRLIEADALELDLRDLAGTPVTIVANLPYNIATALLLRWLGRPESIARMVLMFQREVADRLVAAPRTKAYGRLSVLVQWLCQADTVFHLPARAFVPPPKVASSLVRLEPRPQPLAPADKRALEVVLGAAFNQRRKMLRQSLKPLPAPPEVLLERAAVPATARAEEIDVQGFCRLARALEELGQQPNRRDRPSRSSSG